MITEGVICTRCAHELELEDIWEGEEDYGNTYVFYCPYCGMQEVRWDNSENEKNIYPYWKEDLESDSE